MKKEEPRISKDREIFKMKKRKLDKKNYAKITGTTENEKIKARKREQHKLYLVNIRGSPKHKIRIEKNRNMKNSRNGNDDFMERVNAFKTDSRRFILHLYSLQFIFVQKVSFSTVIV